MTHRCWWCPRHRDGSLARMVIPAAALAPPLRRLEMAVDRPDQGYLLQTLRGGPWVHPRLKGEPTFGWHISLEGA